MLANPPSGYSAPCQIGAAATTTAAAAINVSPRRAIVRPGARAAMDLTVAFLGDETAQASPRASGSATSGENLLMFLKVANGPARRL